MTASTPSFVPNQAYPQWTWLARNSGQTDPFCCQPVWQLTFHQIFHPHLPLLIHEEDGSLMTFCEAEVAPGWQQWMPPEPSWFFGCPLLGDRATELLARQLTLAAQHRDGRAPMIIISGLQPDGLQQELLLRYFGRHFRCYLLQDQEECAASLDGGVGGFLSRRSANHRSKLRRAARKAREKGIAFERHAPTSPDEAARLYTRILAVEAQSWKGLGHCGMDEPPARQFYDLLLRRLASTGDARIILATHEGKDIGFIFGGLAGTVYRGQQFSYHAQWAQDSLGNVLQLEKVTWLCEEGIQRYDMGPLTGERMAYKAHWTEQVLPSRTILLRQR